MQRPQVDQRYIDLSILEGAIHTVENDPNEAHSDKWAADPAWSPTVDSLKRYLAI
jgi:hypothetical protein